MASIINAATSGGLITTADTSGILQLQTAGTTAVTVDASQRAAFVAGTAALPAITTTGDTNTGIFFPAADTIAFAEGGAEAMRIDASGNLGLGVTPSAWYTGYVASQVGVNGSVWANRTTADTTIVGIGSNQFLNSGATNRLYISNGFASRYEQSSGVHSWFTAASGTAGNAISFTQAMTLTASGQLAIGLTSASTTLHVSGATTTDGSIKYNQALQSTAAYNATPMSGTLVALKYNAGGDFAGMGGWSIGKENATDGNYSSYFAMHTRLNGGDIGERARIDSSGRLLVGTTSASNSSHTFKIANSSRMAFDNDGAAPFGLIVQYNSNLNGTSNEFLYCQENNSGGGTARMAVRSNGGIANYSANNVNLSDRREKTNFAPATSYLDKICAIPVQTFNYIDQNMEEDGGLTLGVVAQDVQAVAPELVMESNWAGKDAEHKMRLSIYQTDLQYALMKCIQEQQVLITTLTQRITALEGAQA